MKLQKVGTFNYEMAAISADGKLIVYKSFKPDNTGRIFYKEIKTESNIRLVSKGSMPQVSFDKKYIVFEREENKIFLYNMQGDTTIDISPALSGLQSPAWDPSGNLIFTAGEFPNLGIYRLNLANKKFELLTPGQGMRYGCKFSPDKHVKVIFDSTGDEVLLQFEDRGIGINEADKQRIFEPFYRGENARRIPGQGLGLPLTRRIVTMHHGTFHISSEIEKGTVISLSFPANHQGS